MEDLNLALLAKLGWIFCTVNDKLWVQMLKAKYYRYKTFFEGDCSYADSWLWKGISKSKDLLSKGMCFLVGDGTSIDIWKDPWVPFIPGFRPTPFTPSGNRELGCNMVSDFIIKPTWIWDIVKLQRVFDQAIVDNITKIQITPNQTQDQLAWIHNSKGDFSVKSAYLTDQQVRFSSPRHHPKEVWKLIWNSHLHERYIILLWRLFWDILPI